MLFGSISGSVSVSQMSRLSRLSRFSTAKSRQSVLFSENGDLQMDTFVRRLRRAEHAFEANSTMRDNIARDLADAKVQFRRAKEVVAKKRQRIMDWATKLRQLKREYAENTETIEDAQEDQKRAIAEQGEAEQVVQDLKQELVEQYKVLDEAVDTSAEIPEEDPEYVHVVARHEAVKRSIQDRNQYLLSLQETESAENGRMSELEKEEAALKEKMEEIAKKEQELKEKRDKAMEILVEKPEDLDSFEKMVEKLEADLAACEERCKTFNVKDQEDPSVRRTLADLDRWEGNNARRRMVCENKRALIQERVNALKEIQEKRVMASPKKPGSLAAMAPAEIDEVVKERIEEMTARNTKVMEDLISIDKLEVEQAEQREKSEEEWSEKMEKLEDLREVAREVEQVEVQIQREKERLGELTVNFASLRSKTIVLNRRITAVETEAKVNIDKDPEIIFTRERINEKQLKCTALEKVCNEKHQRVEVATEETNHLDADSEELRKVVLALEDQVKQLGVRLEEANQQLSTEKNLLDQAISKLPIDQKIKILAEL